MNSVNCWVWHVKECMSNFYTTIVTARNTKEALNDKEKGNNFKQKLVSEASVV